MFEAPEISKFLMQKGMRPFEEQIERNWHYGKYGGKCCR